MTIKAPRPTALVSAIAALALVSACSETSDSTPTASGPAIPILEEPLNATDPAPEFVAGESQGITADTVRFIGESAFARYWAAAEEESGLCLLAEVSNSELGGASCSSEEVFRQRGLALHLGGQDVASVQAYLFPTDITSDAVIQALPAELEPGSGSGLELIEKEGNVLLVLDAEAANSLDELEVQREGGQTLPVNLF
ncbi:hypothetical protein ACFSYH_12760 [Populibacterium corticicola]|uniref:Uncharacterized protein n=1 Tax=Populibacterium corticicola TaxID=1812826 RepID=A0ABW5XIA8_9MICO